MMQCCNDQRTQRSGAPEEAGVQISVVIRIIGMKVAAWSVEDALDPWTSPYQTYGLQLSLHFTSDVPLHAASRWGGRCGRRRGGTPHRRPPALSGAQAPRRSAFGAAGVGRGAHESGVGL